jgi:hypothetical protein
MFKIQCFCIETGQKRIHSLEKGMKAGGKPPVLKVGRYLTNVCYGNILRKEGRKKHK